MEEKALEELFELIEVKADEYKSVNASPEELAALAELTRATFEALVNYRG